MKRGASANAIPASRRLLCRLLCGGVGRLNSPAPAQLSGIGPTGSDSARADKLPPEGYSGQWTTQVLLSTVACYPPRCGTPGLERMTRVLGATRFEFSRSGQGASNQCQANRTRCARRYAVFYRRRCEAWNLSVTADPWRNKVGFRASTICLP